MVGKLEKSLAKLCEKLPLNITIYEKKGFCEKPNKICEYCRKNPDDTYFCYKKTRTLSKDINNFITSLNFD